VRALEALRQPRADRRGRYLSGGVESGFAHVERDSWPTRLLHVKGRRNVRVLEVPAAVSSLNQGDVFILDAGLTLFVWNGAEASRAEKLKGAEVARAVNADERGGRAALLVLEAGGEGERDFLAALGWAGEGAPPILSAAEGGGDEEAEAAAAPRLFRQPPGGALAELPERPLARAMLASDSVCVLVAGGAAYAWVGKAAGKAEKAAALATAAEGAKAAALPPSAQLRCVKEGAEPPLFTQAFFRWHAPSMPVYAAPQPGAPRVSETVDVAALVQSAKAAAAAAEEAAVVEQPGSGKVSVWRIESFERAPVPPEQYGQFYAGDSYVVLYTYRDGSNRDAAFIYFWLGRGSSQDERAAAALQTKALCDAMGGSPVHVRVAQGREPRHFCQLWGGRFVVHSGGHPSGFKNAEAAAEAGAVGSAPALYHVRGSGGHSTHAVQVALGCASLNSGDCFALLLPAAGGAAAAAHVWEGKYSSEEERATARAVAASLGGAFGVRAPPALQAEGGESEAFWAALGGRGPYSAFAEGATPSQAPRLFQLCDAAAGGAGVRCEEVHAFGQDDLCDDDVMLLDVVSAVFLWVGGGATENEKREADALAERYVAACAAVDGRPADTPVVRCRAGEEPSIFTCHFLGWDASKQAAFRDPQQERERAAAAAAAEAAAARDAAEAAAAEELSRRAAASLRVQEEAEAAKAAARAAEAAAAEAAEAQAAAVRAAKVAAQEAAREAAKAKPEEAAPAPAAPASADVAGSGAGAVTIPPGSKTFGLLALRGMTQSQDGIDGTAKELYLSAAEFKAVLGCAPAEFAALPLWKRSAAKKSAGIF